MTDATAPTLAAAREGAPPAIRVGDVFGRSQKMFAAHWLAYCGMMALGYAPIAILTAGLAAKVIPAGEWHAIGPAIPACMIEGVGPLSSMRRSAFLTKGNRWRTFGILCVLYLGGAAVEQLVKFILDLLTSAIPALAISMIFDIAVGAFSAVALGALYAQLRIAREGVDIEDIAEVFD